MSYQTCRLKLKSIREQKFFRWHVTDMLILLPVKAGITSPYWTFITASQHHQHLFKRIRLFKKRHFWVKRPKNSGGDVLSQKRTFSKTAWCTQYISVWVQVNLLCSVDGSTTILLNELIFRTLKEFELFHLLSIKLKHPIFGLERSDIEDWT